MTKRLLFSFFISLNNHKVLVMTLEKIQNWKDRKREKAKIQYVQYIYKITLGWVSNEQLLYYYRNVGIYSNVVHFNIAEWPYF